MVHWTLAPGRYALGDDVFFVWGNHGNPRQADFSKGARIGLGGVVRPTGCRPCQIEMRTGA